MRYLNLVGVSFAPSKAYPPLIVDPNAVLAYSIPRQLLKPVTRRNAKIL